MTRFLLLAFFAFTAVAHAYTYPFTLDCTVTSTKTEVDDESLKDEGYEYLRDLLSAKTAQIAVDGEYTVLKFFNRNGEGIDFLETKYDGTTAKTTIRKTKEPALKQYESENYKKRGEVPFYNDELAPFDNSFTSYFHLIFKRVDLDRGNGAMIVRIWTASREPNNKTNIFMSCQTR